jgi:hypothetical protein
MDVADVLLDHVAHVKHILSLLPTAGRFVFAAACAERQWPVYLRGSEGKPWAEVDTLRSGLDAVWGCLINADVLPSSLAHSIDRAVQRVATDQPADSHAFHVANSLFGLVSIVLSNRSDFAYQMAQANLNLIDAFLHGFLQLRVGGHDTLIDQHPLSEAERRRQLHDLAKIGQSLDSALVTEIRNASVGQSVLGNSWYG